MLGSGDEGLRQFLVAIPVSTRCFVAAVRPAVLGPDDIERAIHGFAVYAVVTGWLHGARTGAISTVAAGLSGLAAHRMVVGINSPSRSCPGPPRDRPAVGVGYRTSLFFAPPGLEPSWPTS